jgi:HPt (histidine-containing phosphotransfer) domain-containing protein
MRDALGRGAVSEVQRAAHPLRSSSATLGARHLAALCGELEEHCRAGGGHLAELVAAVETAYRPVARELEARLAANKSGT